MKQGFKMSACCTSQLTEMENAASAAHTYLQKNPNDTLMVERMKIYTSIPDLEDSLTNHEEKLYEVWPYYQ